LAFGDKIGYVITKGAGRLYEKAKPYILSSIEEVDVEYYVTNQIVPAASRILTLFGISKEALIPSEKAKSLLEFAGN